MPTVEDILNQRVTIVSSLNAHGLKEGAWCTNSSLISILLTDKFKDRIDEYRKLKTIDPVKAHQYKTDSIPAWMVSGTFPYFRLHNNDIVTYNNLIALDIDAKDGDNETIIDNVRKDIFSKPYVVAVLKSLGGKGIYVLVYVEDPKHTEGYYSYLADLYEQQYNIKVDRNAMNIARKRCVSYEDDITKWIKPNDMIIKPWRLYDDIVEGMIDNKPPQQYIPDRIKLQTTLFDNNFVTERTKEAIIKSITIGGLSVDYFNKKQNNSALNVWWHIGNEIKYFFGDVEGEQLFYQFSTNTSQYNDDQRVISKQFESCDADKAIDGKYTKTEDDLHSKWQGIAKNLLGIRWWKK